MKKLPDNWKVIEFPSTIEIYDENDRFVEGIGKPYEATPMGQIIHWIMEKVSSRNVEN